MKKKLDILKSTPSPIDSKYILFGYLVIKRNRFRLCLIVKRNRFEQNHLVHHIKFVFILFNVCFDSANI